MFYSQRNPRWSGDNLGFGYTTIGDYGCVITSFGNGLDVTPPVVNEALKRVNGYTGSNRNLVIWRKVEEAFPELTLKSLTHCVTVSAPVDKIDDALENNDLVLIRIDMNLHKAGIQHHWLYIFGGNSKDGYNIYDPWALSDGQRLLPPAYSKEDWNAARAIYSVVIYSRGVDMRKQYKRTYVLLHPQADQRWASAVAKKTWDKHRYTIGGSADDAGIGALLEDKTVIAVNPHKWNDDLENFFKVYYPGTVFKAVYADKPEDLFNSSPPPPPPPPPPGPLGELITLHLQTPVDGWLNYVTKAKPGWVKTVGNFELNAPPGTKVLARQYLSANDQQKYLDNFHYVENDEDKYWDAGHFLDRFWDSIVANAHRVKAVEGLNETIATGDMPGIEKAVRFEVSFAEELAKRCKEANIDVRACLLNTAVGNPQHGYEVEKLIPAVRAAVKCGGYIGYHSYFPCHAVHAERWIEEEGYHHHERAILSWDPVFAKYGLAPRYLFTEAGAIGMGVRPDGRPDSYDPDAGWRASINSERYAKLLVMVRNRLNNWNFKHGNRVESMMIFTSGEGVGWKSFQFKNPQMIILLKVL